MTMVRKQGACVRMRGTVAVLVATITWIGGAAYGGAQTPDGQTAALEKRLADIAAAHHGKVALFATQLNTGRVVAIDGDEPVQTASVIKLAILYEAMAEVRAGKAHWDEKVVLAKGYAVGGSGVLHFLDAPLTLTLKDALTLMVIMSDNTATDLVIDRLGVDAVNIRMESLGLRNTHLYKRVFKPPVGKMPADQPKFGLGKTTAREMGTLMEWIGRCNLRQIGPSNGRGAWLANADADDKAVCKVGLTMLKGQFYRDTIPRYLPNGGDQTVASKTGSLDAVRNDVAIVAGKGGPMVISIFTYDNADKSWTADNEGELTIAKLAREVVSAWSSEGLEGKTLVPGLGLPGVR